MIDEKQSEMDLSLEIEDAAKGIIKITNKPTMKDIPDNMENELKRLHGLIIEALGDDLKDTSEIVRWCLKRIGNIHSLLFESSLRMPEDLSIRD